VCPSFKNLLSNSQALRQCYCHMLRKQCLTLSKCLISGHLGAFDALLHLMLSLQYIMLYAKTYLQAAHKWLPIMTYIHPLCYKCCLSILHFVDFCQKYAHLLDFHNKNLFWNPQSNLTKPCKDGPLSKSYPTAQTSIQYGHSYFKWPKLLHFKQKWVKI
jgi:hypothetical protein